MDATTQHRGDRDAYARYLAGMDASMRQKVALTAAHLLARGRVADMGMGSGAGSHALAALYPALDVFGVDLDPAIVEIARGQHRAPNLRFVVADIGRPVFRAGSLDGVFDSSVLHHLTSYGGYERENAGRALALHAEALREGGVLIVRDFVDPGDGEALLDLPADDGDAGDAPATCSTAALFLRFAREFRSLSARPGFPFEEAPAPRPGWRRFRVARRHAVEFVLRKDYRADWAAEAREEYGYFSQAEFEARFARLGLRVLASTPIRNPWIVRHRFRGRFEWRDATGRALEWPATNYVVVGERVPAGEGVTLREAAPRAPLGFLEMTHWRRRGTGRVMDLVRRPNLTLDVIPWFEAADGAGRGELFVMGRMSYPRPVLRCGRGPAVDGARAADYVTEPLNVLKTDRPLGSTVEDALERDAAIPPARIRGFRRGASYYPSPGGIEEEVRSALVEVEASPVERPLENRSGFSTSGRVRAIEARQLLRAAQVGGLPDARLEANVYELLLRLGRDAGPWIGEAIALAEGKAPRRRTTLAALADRPSRRAFERARAEESAGFLELRAADFEELDAAGAVLVRKPLEYVVPRALSTSTVAVAPLLRRGSEVLLGVEDDDLAAAQGFTGGSELLVAPAWRLPREVDSMTAAIAWTRARLEREHGLVAGEAFELGGRYHPSPGVTPEVVHPLAVEVLEERDAPRPLAWVALADAVARRDLILDGHLRAVALRAAHALGLLASA